MHYSVGRGLLPIVGGLLAAGLLGSCSSSTTRTRASTPPAMGCKAASSAQIARINASAVHPGSVKAGDTASIPDDDGFDSLVAAKVSQAGNPIGVWALGSDGGVVAGVNPVAQADNTVSAVRPGSVAAGVLHQIRASSAYAALVACASR